MGDGQRSPQHMASRGAALPSMIAEEHDGHGQPQAKSCTITPSWVSRGYLPD